MLDDWNQILSDLHGLPTKSGESNLAMLWESINEDSALVTYLKNFFPEDKDGVVIKVTGIWLLKDGAGQPRMVRILSRWYTVIEHNGILKTVIEIKCPFMGGKPIPYKNVCINHIPQIMFEMFCTSTKRCHYVVWTPIGTNFFLIELLLNCLYKFWDLASRKFEPAWHEDVSGLKQKSKEIALKSPCIRFISTQMLFLMMT